jgi:uncharacterized protein
MRSAVLGLTLQLALIGLLAGSSAQAAQSVGSKATPGVASFDCGHASTPQERLICSDPELSALDGQLGKTYREKRALLSPKGAELLKSSQRNWLRYISTVCAPKSPNAPLGKDPKTCLKQEYTGRLAALQDVAKKIGPFLFNRIDLYTAEPSDDNTGSNPGFYIQHVSYPQIDNADTPELVAWNQKNLLSLSSDSYCDSNPNDYEIGYELGIANSHMISVEWDHSTYCHGTPHGFWDVKIWNTVLSAHLRQLAESDIFGPDTAWAEPLKERLWRKLLESGWRPPENQSEDDVKSQIEDDFVNPDEWFFTNEGLRISFTAYEGGCYACTPQPITLSWAELKPLLSARSIAP